MLSKNYFLAKRIDQLMEKLIGITNQLEDKAKLKLEQKYKKAA